MKYISTLFTLLFLLFCVNHCASGSGFTKKLKRTAGVFIAHPITAAAIGIGTGCITGYALNICFNTHSCFDVPKIISDHVPLIITHRLANLNTIFARIGILLLKTSYAIILIQTSYAANNMIGRKLFTRGAQWQDNKYTGIDIPSDPTQILAPAMTNKIQRDVDEDSNTPNSFVSRYKTYFLAQTFLYCSSAMLVISICPRLRAR